MRAFFNFYLTVNVFNIAASLIVSIISGFSYLPIVFCTFGTAIGLACYDLYFKQQYYFYHNIGYTRSKLALNAFILNSVVALPFLLINAIT